MNRFKIILGCESDFEDVWRNRESHLDEVEGFIGFNLVKGATTEEFTLYASHSTWESQKHFEAWTKSESFRKAHKNAGSNRKLYIGHPQFEGFNVVLFDIV